METPLEYDFPNNRFSVYDYVVFGLVLLVSAGIGVFFGCRKKKDETTDDVLLANKSMTLLPTSMSLLASFMSAITLLGTPAEIYVFGTQYMVILFGFILMVPIAGYITYPVFHKLQITSVNEYLELRFHRSLRIIGAVAFLVQTILYMAIVLYTPAIALTVVTGVNTWIIVCVVGLVCTFYTSLGGMKAVMWTDTFQVFMMFGGLLAVLIQGSIDKNGFTEIWQDMNDTGRVQFTDFSPDPLVRHTVWSLVIGGAFFWAGLFGVNQAQVQRALSVPTLKNAQNALWVNLVGLLGLQIVCCLCGMVAFSEYRYCDPLDAGRIEKRDQLLPLYVMDKFALTRPGLPGFFTAGIFAAALSSISSGLNSMAAVTLQDLIKLSDYSKKFSEKQFTIIAKVLPLGYGVMMIACAYFASILPGVLQGAYAMFGMIQGPMMGLFLLGMLFPCANWKGGLVGTIVSFVIIVWISVSAIIYAPPVAGIPPRSIENCPLKNMSMMTTAETSPWTQDNMITATQAAAVTEDDMPAGYLSIYALSYMWSTAFAILITCVVGIIASLLTGGNDPSKQDPRLYCPILDTFCCYLPSACRRKMWCGVQHDKEMDEEDDKKGDGHNNGVVNMGADFSKEFNNGLNPNSVQLVEVTKIKIG